jgi:hypothetical protein
VAANPLDTVALITWTTDEPTTSQVTYGISPTPDQTTTESIEYTTSHSITLTNLEPATDYVYAVISRDQAGNQAVSSVFNFQTIDSTSLEQLYLPIILNIASFLVPSPFLVLAIVI